nr:hypothetical protein [Pelosinus fermentans]
MRHGAPYVECVLGTDGGSNSWRAVRCHRIDAAGAAGNVRCLVQGATARSNAVQGGAGKTGNILQ